MNNPVNPQKTAPLGSIEKYQDSKLLLETSTFFWKTDLIPEAGEEFVSSTPFTYKSESYPGSEFFLSVKPNNVDKSGTRFLSAFLSVSGPVDQILANFNIDLLTGVLSDEFQSRASGLVEFTRNSPCFGFEDYIPMYRLNHPRKLKYYFRVRLQTLGKVVNSQPISEDKA